MARDSDALMKTHRFIGPYQLAEGTLRIDDDALAHQMRSVLHLEPGEVVVIGDGRGTEAQCRILRYERGAVIVESLSLGNNTNELPGRTVLYCAVLKSDHFEMAAQKAAEVGVSEIVPILTERTVKGSLNIDRVRKIIREASEVAGRGLIPTVREVIPMERVLTEAGRNDVNFFFDLSGKPFAGAAKSVRHAGIWIGPEGGWSATELERAHQLGMRTSSLGKLILRSETAVIIACYLVAHSLKS